MNRHRRQSRLGALLLGTAVAATSLMAGFVGTTLAANPSANLDQCANGSLASPNSPACNPTEWVNGNLGPSKAHYNEGDSIPYRMRFDNLTLASHTVTFEWDTTKSGKHALDYITSFDRTVTTANPCVGVANCNSSTTYAIPKDGQVDNGSGSPINQLAGNLTLFGGNITAVSAYSYPNGAGFAGDKSARITVTFTATKANPVLAWGGHIATRANWGPTNAAVAISGSPYHMRLVNLDGSGGNQDRSLSADAVTFPASITIIKDANPNGAQDFGFSTTGGLTPATFNLDDDADNTLSNTQSYTGITNFGSYTVTEAAAAGWTLTFASPVCSVTSPNGGSQSGNVGTRTISIGLKEGENVTCTFTNTRQGANLIIIKDVINDNGGSKSAGDFSGTISGAVVASGGNTWTGTADPGVTKSLTSVGSYNITETTAAGYTVSYSADCSGTIAFGETKTCTVTNNDNAPGLHLRKTITNDDGGTAAITDWTLTATGTVASPTNLSGTTPVDSVAGFKADTYTLAESGGPSGYTAGAWSCVGGSQDGNKITVALGESVTCTINNDDDAATLIVKKVVVNNNGGMATADDFGFKVNNGTTQAFEADGQNDLTVDAGTYTVTEPAAAGYSTTYDNCSSLVIPNGGTATCTITNTDDAPALHLRKEVVNNSGGSADETDWTLSATGTLASPTNLSGSTPVDSDGTFKADTYTLAESGGPSGYTASAWVCVGGTQDGTKITVALGESATCTITNDDDAAKLIVKKILINDNGGTAEKDDFSYTVNGGSAIPFEADGQNEAAVDAGTYSVLETAASGYTTTYDNCTDVVIPNGGEATCTITNDDTKAGPTVATDMSWTLHDSATITGLRAGGGSHSVTFRLFLGAANCAAGTPVLFTQTVIDATGNLTSFGPVDFATSTPGTYYWTAQYSGNQNNTGFLSGCGDEITTIGQTNTSHLANDES